MSYPVEGYYSGAYNASSGVRRDIDDYDHRTMVNVWRELGYGRPGDEPTAEADDETGAAVMRWAEFGHTEEPMTTEPEEEVTLASHRDSPRAGGVVHTFNP